MRAVIVLCALPIAVSVAACGVPKETAECCSCLVTCEPLFGVRELEPAGDGGGYVPVHDFEVADEERCLEILDDGRAFSARTCWHPRGFGAEDGVAPCAEACAERYDELSLAAGRLSG